SLYPNVRVINATVTGGAGVNAKAVLKTRMLGGDPPDTFQVHAGQELIGTWVLAARMEDLTFPYEEEGWYDVLPEELIKALSADQGIWSAAVSGRRCGARYHRPEDLGKWGGGVPTTWGEFFEVAGPLQAQGVVRLSVGESWRVSHPWESVASSVIGP